MGLNRRDDLFMMQIRLFRMAQIKWNKSVGECEKIFSEYAINDYIKMCYEEFHVQSDEANMDEIDSYLQRKGFRI